MAKTDYDLLLIGKTGVGKSQTGNTILDKKAFQASSGTASATNSAEWGVREYKKKVVKPLNLRDLRHLQKIRNLHNLSNICNLPNLQNLRNLPNLPNICKLPNLQNLRNLHNLPNICKLPNLQNLRKLPNICKLPNLENLRNLHNLPNIYKLPNLQNLCNLHNRLNICNLFNLQNFRNLHNLHNICKPPNLLNLRNLPAFNVVDVPGVFDTRNSQDGNHDFEKTKMKEAMLLNPAGYHAFLVVLRYGQRFTEEECAVVKFLKAMFGEEFMKDYCILLLTNGDGFERDFEEDGKTFEQWCQEQPRVFRDILTECGNRIVIFDNVTKDEAKRNDQLDTLLALVDSLLAKGRRYTDANFKQAADLLEKAEVEAGMPVITTGILQELSLIIDQANRAKSTLDPDESIPLLKGLAERCDTLNGDLKQQDKGTGALSGLMEKVEETKQSVVNVIICASTNANDVRREKMKEAFDNLTLQLNHEYRMMREESTRLESRDEKIQTVIKTVAYTSCGTRAVADIVASVCSMYGGAVVGTGLISQAAAVIAPLAQVGSIAIQFAGYTYTPGGLKKKSTDNPDQTRPMDNKQNGL